MKISFKHAHHNPSFRGDNKRYSKEGEPYVVSPFALYWNNGNYYLYAYLSDKNEFRFFRIDRMESIKLETARREGHEKFSAATLQSKRKAKVFDMFATGNEVNVTLRGINKVADQVIDAFGSKTMLMPDKQEGYFSVKDLVDVSPTFFAWVSTFGDLITIVKPEETKEEFQEFLRKALDQY